MNRKLTHTNIHSYAIEILPNFKLNTSWAHKPRTLQCLTVERKKLTYTNQSNWQFIKNDTVISNNIFCNLQQTLQTWKVWWCRQGFQVLWKKFPAPNMLPVDGKHFLTCTIQNHINGLCWVKNNTNSDCSLDLTSCMCKDPISSCQEFSYLRFKHWIPFREVMNIVLPSAGTSFCWVQYWIISFGQNVTWNPNWTKNFRKICAIIFWPSARLWSAFLSIACCMMLVNA